ncbi:MAG: hypothetical protein ACKPKO_38305, partial [Candidatus Fonsibacter sp.]
MTYTSVYLLPSRRRAKAETSAGDFDETEQSVSIDGGGLPDQGSLASVACSLLMKVIWAARLARPDLLRTVSYLATTVTKSASLCDAMLQRLMGYIQNPLHLKMVG